MRVFVGLGMDIEEVARWTYIAFLSIAIVAGLVVGYMAFSTTGGWSDPGVTDINSWVVLIMLILGIIIGLVGSITTKEFTPFLLSTIALMVAGVRDVWAPLNDITFLQILYYWATTILRYIVAFAAPAAVIIAIRSILAITKD